MSSNFKSLLTLLGFSLLAYGVYYMSTVYDIFDSARIRASEIEQQTALLEREVLSRLDDINRIDFEDSVFEREDYRTLRDLSVQLPAPSVSRPNPFAELP